MTRQHPGASICKGRLLTSQPLKSPARCTLRALVVFNTNSTSRKSVTFAWPFILWFRRFLDMIFLLLLMVCCWPVRRFSGAEPHHGFPFESNQTDVLFHPTKDSVDAGGVWS